MHSHSFDILLPLFIHSFIQSFIHSFLLYFSFFIFYFHLCISPFKSFIAFLYKHEFPLSISFYLFHFYHIRFISITIMMKSLTLPNFLLFLHLFALLLIFTLKLALLLLFSWHHLGYLFIFLNLSSLYNSFFSSSSFFSLFSFFHLFFHLFYFLVLILNQLY